jgi:excisionase family DNA binding protein
MSLRQAAEHLGVHYMTAYRYVRTGRLPATRQAGEWQIRAIDVERLLEAPAPGTPPAADATATARAGLERRILAGDGAGAWAVVESRLSGGLDPSGVLTDLLVPVLQSIGERWASGELSVADEHRATAVSHRLLGRLSLQFGRRGRTRGTVVLAASSGDLHTLPVAIVADLLRWRGFEVVELGGNTPPEAIAEAASRAGRLVAVGIVSTAGGLDAQVAAAVAAVRQSVPGVPILLGGGAISDEAHARRLGADVWTGGATTSALEAVERIAGSPGGRGPTRSI